MIRIFAVFCLVSIMSACVQPVDTSDSDSIIEQKFEKYSTKPDSDHDVPLTREIAKPWPGPISPVRNSVIVTKPPIELHNSIRINLVEPVSLRKAARLLSAHSGIQIQVAEDIQLEGLADLHWNGTTVEALDYISDLLGVSWRSTAKGVTIYRTEHGYWTLYAPSTVVKWQASVGLSGAVKSGRGGSDLNARDQVSVTMDTTEFWNQIESMISGLLSSAGTFTLNRQSGELIVRDTPETLDRIDQWVTSKNENLSTQVQLLVELYEVEQTKDATAGFNIMGLMQDAFGKNGLALEIGSDDSGEIYGLRATHDELTSPLDVTNILLALRKAAGGGRVAKLTSTVLRGINGMPTPVFFGDETSYLQRRDVVKDEGTTSVRLVAGQLQDGIALNLVPKVLPDSDRLMLNITVRTTRIKGLSRFPSDAGPSDPVIQLPDLESRSMLLPVLLRSGETLLVAGFDTNSSLISRSKGLLSRLRRSDSKRSQLVMFITPTIMRMPAKVITNSFAGLPR